MSLVFSNVSQSTLKPSFVTKLYPKTVSTNYTVNVGECFIQVNASGGARTITLPPASQTAGQIYIIQKIDSSTNAVTVSTTAGGNVNLTSQYAATIVISNGTAYYKIV